MTPPAPVAAPRAPLDALGPSPFRYDCARLPLEGPAFGWSFRLLCGAVVLGSAGWLLLLWHKGALATSGASVGQGLGWVLAALGLMGLTAWHVLRSRTRLDAEGLHQSWIWDKHLPLRELAWGKLIRVPGLDWLIAPRLYVRTLLGKFAVFYAADPRLLAEFEQLLAALRECRGPR